MKVYIAYEGKEGFIEWEEDKVYDFVVEFEDNIKKEEEIIDYLMTKRKFIIPESNKIDDFRVDDAFPTDSDMYFRLALNELWAYTDVWVTWKK